MKRKKKQPILPVILLGGVVLLSIGGLVLAQNLRQRQIESPGPVSNQDEIPRLSAKEAYEAQNNGAVLVDTRSESQFQASHAAGAINMPETDAETRFSGLDPAAWYITYCT